MTDVAMRAQPDSRHSSRAVLDYVVNGVKEAAA